MFFTWLPRWLLFHKWGDIYIYIYLQIEMTYNWYFGPKMWSLQESCHVLIHVDI